MVQQHDNSDSIISQDESYDAVDQPGLSNPYSQNEIDDLLYSSERSVEDRIQRLSEIRAEMQARASGDFGGQDGRDMLAEIDRALDELRGDSQTADNNAELAPEAVIDPDDHLDTLAPDDIDARSALTGEDEELFADDEDGPVDDDNVWQGSEEFRHDMH